MNRNKKTKNVKQNKAINSITEKTMDMNVTKTTFHNGSPAKNKQLLLAKKLVILLKDKRRNILYMYSIFLHYILYGQPVNT